ncbi:MAG: SIMPL domain-containing protein [Candidatus Coatesbacteria bacterium]|nr:SIMPL domain-containing protein [Candidatus Coatesbacteria bacterium]
MFSCYLMMFVLLFADQGPDLALSSRNITVTGTGKVDLPAEFGRVSFTLVVESKLEEAQLKFASLENKAIEIGKRFGLEASDFQFNYLYINLKPGTLLTSDKVNLSKSGSVKVKRINSIPALVSALLKEGISVSPYINYEVEDMSKIKMLAFKQAIIAAQTKADIVAQQLGAKNLQILRFSEYSPYDTYRGYNQPVAQSNVSYSEESRGGFGNATMSKPRVVYQLTVTAIFMVGQ